MTLTNVEPRDASAPGHYSEPIASYQNDTDGSGVYPVVRTGDTSLFRRGASASLAHPHEFRPN